MAAALPPGAPGAPDRAVPDEARQLQRRGCGGSRRWRTAAAEGSIAGFMSPEQRGLFAETQLVMSLMEGFSDWVMDDVGEQVLPDVARHPAPLRGAAQPAPAGHRPASSPASPGWT